ncbi:MAG: universal stress protein [Firmicutes bacterium]|nr:universal stress protein [Bacillota bacterium]
MRKYLLAADGSEGSMKAAYFLLDLVRDINEYEITVVYVNNIKKEIYNYPLLTYTPGTEEMIQKQSEEIVDETAAILENEGVRVNKVILDGDPAQEISRYAEELGVNQIVMGTRGLSNIRGLVVGSVGQRVIHLANNPVTLVKQLKS